MNIQKETLSRWTTQNSSELYGIQNWGAGYFGVNDKGEIIITPYGQKSSVAISLMDIVSGIKQRGLEMPVLLRFENLLDSQIHRLNEAFRKNIEKFNYKSTYQGVYPIKVNQQAQVIEAISHFGSKFHHGFEAGSKAELIAAISMITDPQAILICNGYKDEEFIELGLYAQKMGVQLFFVIEMITEVPLIISKAKQLGVRPNLGVRLKLSSKVGGHWSDSGGDRSLFGLNTSQLVETLNILKENEMIDCLKLMHYHLGSQIPNIRDIRSALVEASRYYVGLIREGATMGYFDLGGGLAVDYDGSQTNFQSSRNYTLDEYCADIIEVIMEIMDNEQIPHPTLVTESGRAIVAYSSVLLFDVVDVMSFESVSIPEKLPENTNELIYNLLDVTKTMSQKNIQECYNDAIFYRDGILELFRHGQISLRERSLAEVIFWHIINTIAIDVKKMKNPPSDLEELDSAICDIYYCNFSVFQSLPDSWAIEHLFPIMPIHRLNEYPDRQCVIADITCDCDGKIDRFIDLHDVSKTLPVHRWNPGSEYFLGVFLVGAYQETLGDLHNLMGDTHVVSIHIHENGEYDLVKELEGDSIADVLSYVEYNPKVLAIKLRDRAERAVKSGKISLSERRIILDFFEQGMRGYTYYKRHKTLDSK